jgi:hypothetical protein
LGHIKGISILRKSHIAVWIGTAVLAACSPLEAGHAGEPLSGPGARHGLIDATVVAANAQVVTGGPQHGQVLPPGAIRVRRVDIIDRNGFEKLMVATTVFVPDGWQTQGGILWNAQNSCGFGYNIDFRATAPDGRSGLHFFPMEQWQWSSMGGGASPGCPVQRITSVHQ